MSAAKYICTHCGYEGKPVRPPSDETYAGESDTAKALTRASNLLLPGMGLIIRPLAWVLVAPIYLVLWPIKRAMNAPKHCQNCGLPLMVKKTSDAGYIALRKMEVKEGKRFEVAAEPKLAFGKEIRLPGDEEPKKSAPPPVPDKLPSLHDLLQEAPAPVPPEPQPEPVQPNKKPVDPDQW